MFFLFSGESLEELNGYGTYRPRNIISTILGGTPSKAKHLWISNPQDFRQVKYIFYEVKTFYLFIFILGICNYRCRCSSRNMSASSTT